MRTLQNALLVLFAALVMLGGIFSLGCAQFQPQTAALQADDQLGQTGQGKDRWEATVPCPSASDPDRVCPVVVDLGRDKEHVSMKISTSGGLAFEYVATNASGADQAAVRADLEKAISEASNETTRQVLRTIIDNLPNFMPNFMPAQ